MRVRIRCVLCFKQVLGFGEKLAGFGENLVELFPYCVGVFHDTMKNLKAFSFFQLTV